jgi:hypothetical protein
MAWYAYVIKYYNFFSLVLRQLKSIESWICYGICDTMFSLFKKDMESFEDKRQDIRFKKQISVTRISNHPSKFHFSSNVFLIF